MFTNCEFNVIQYGRKMHSRIKVTHFFLYCVLVHFSSNLFGCVCVCQWRWIMCQWWWMCLTPFFTVWRRGELNPPSLGFMRKWPWRRKWATFRQMERLWSSPAPSADTSPAWWATNWDTVQPHTPQVQHQCRAFINYRNYFSLGFEHVTSGLMNGRRCSVTVCVCFRAVWKQKKVHECCHRVPPAAAGAHSLISGLSNVEVRLNMSRCFIFNLY